ncbi:unnamed protein product [Penicillium olsonii]|nr:unnamed protein product [Penicillium olsonii]
MFHLGKAGSFSTDLVECLNGFFQNNNHDLEAWIEIWSAYQTHVSPSCSILHVAAYSGIAEFVRLLLSRGATTDVVDKDGHTPLVYAVSKGHHDIVTLLLEHGASTNVTVRDDTFSWGAGHHLLAYACKLNHVNAVRALIQGGLDPMAKVITGGGGKTRIPDDPTEHDLRPYYFDHRREVTALASACEEGSTEAVLDLIRHVDPLLCKDNLLHSAAEQGKHEILSALLRNDKVRLTINDPDRYGDTPIYLAARKQSPTTIKVLLNHGADVSILSMNRNYPPEPPTELESQTMPHAIPGYTPLHAVAFGYPNGNFEQPMNEEAVVVCLDLLIDAGSKVNTGNHKKRTPIFEWSRIHWSTMSEDKFVSALLERGADASILDVDGQTPLHSSQRVYPKLAKILVNAGCNINAQRFSDGLTVLMLNASQQNHPDPIVFHKLGADFHQQDWLGNTALHHYFKSDPLGESCHLDSWLSKSNPHTRNYLGRTPLHEFLSLTHGKFWDEEEEEESRLDRLRTIDEFLKHGVSLEDQDGLGQTALLTAFSGNEFHTFKLVEELLRRGASAQATDFKGRTALHYVFRPDKKSSLLKDGSKRELAQLLINHGARVQDTDHDGNGFFKHFIKDDTVHNHGDWLINEEHAETIIELGAPILTANKQGRTALHAAATIEEDLIFRQGKIRTRLEFLLRPSMQFDINAADNSGITALHLAASVSDINVLTLIQHGADPKAKDRSMRTPLSIAAEAGQSNVVGLLLEYCQNDPAIINHQCIKRRSALHEAARSGCPETVKLLLDAGANPFLSDERGRTALHAAGEFEERTGPQKARHHQISQPPLLGLPKPCAWRGVKKPDPPSGYDFGIAPNDDARCIREVVRLLLAAGAQPNKVDNNGLSPKCVAVMLGCAPVVEELRKSHMESSIRSFDPIGESLLVVTDAQIKNIVDLTEVPDNHNELLERLFVTGNEDLVEEFVRVKHLKLVDSEKDRSHETGIFLLPLLGFTTMLKRLLPYLEDAADLIPVLLSQATKRSAYNLEMMRLLIQQVPRENRHIFSNFLVEVSAGKRWWHTKALTLLLEKGVCPETWSSSAFRSAITAAFPVKSYGDGEERHKWSDETLRMLLKHGADAKDTRNDHADSLLSTAVENGGDAWIIALLLEHGASIEPGDDKLLTLAIRRNSLATVELLLKNGADPNATNDWRKAPLLEEPRSAKLLSEHAAIVSLLLRYGADPLLLIEDGSTIVFHTLCTNHWGGTSLGPILEMGIDVDTKDSEGRTALSRSANCFDVALKLIEAGADLDMIDPTGSTALHYAAEAFDEALVGELVKRSASVDPVDNDGFTPSTRALKDYAEADDCWSSGFLTLRALLNGGANALTILPDGRLGLHCVAPVLRDFSNKDRKEQIKEDDGRDHFTEATTLYQQFLDAGCDRNSRDRNGETPIFHYVRAPKSYQRFSDLARSRPSHPDDWTAFIETHDISPMNLAGDTLLHVIARRAKCPPDSGDDETLLFKALVDSGLDPWKENNQSETALDIAAAQEKTDILGLFARNE